MNRSRNRGFTLIELLIVVVVLAILAAVAINAYRDYVLQSNRNEAMSALMELAQLQEEYFGNRQAYTGSLATLNYPATTDNDLYRLEVSTSAAVGYVLQATTNDSQTQDDTCRTFVLDGMGQRSAENAGGGTTTAECWNR